MGTFPSDGELIKHLNVAPSSLRVNPMDSFDRTVYKPFVSDDSFVAVRNKMKKKKRKENNWRNFFNFRFQWMKFYKFELVRGEWESGYVEGRIAFGNGLGVIVPKIK